MSKRKGSKSSKDSDGSKLPEHLEETHYKMKIDYLHPSNVRL